ncbi:MAG: flagellar FlbD family protein [FCB group bacterium]|jgi:flagellar protein FlbD
MITLTKIDSRQITINADEIETMETSHDTTISLISGRKIIVKESTEEIIEKVIQYRQLCFKNLFIKPDYSSQ